MIMIKKFLRWQSPNFSSIAIVSKSNQHSLHSFKDRISNRIKISSFLAKDVCFQDCNSVFFLEIFDYFISFNWRFRQSSKDKRIRLPISDSLKDLRSLNLLSKLLFSIRIRNKLSSGQFKRSWIDKWGSKFQLFSDNKSICSQHISFLLKFLEVFCNTHFFLWFCNGEYTLVLCRIFIFIDSFQ
jgi:hypothetical protein